MWAKGASAIPRRGSITSITQLAHSQLLSPNNHNKDGRSSEGPGCNAIHARPRWITLGSSKVLPLPLGLYGLTLPSQLLSPNNHSWTGQELSHETVLEIAT